MYINLDYLYRYMLKFSSPDNGKVSSNLYGMRPIKPMKPVPNNTVFSVEMRKFYFKKNCTN